jgi:hypothetical protein
MRISRPEVPAAPVRAARDPGLARGGAAIAHEKNRAHGLRERVSRAARGLT